MSKIVKILLWAPGATEVAVEIGADKKKFLEVTIEPRDENITTGPSLGAFIQVNGFPNYRGLPQLPNQGLVPVPLSPGSTTKVAEDEAVKRAVTRKLREYNLNIDASRLVIKTLTEADKTTEGNFVYTASYKLSDSEKFNLERRHIFNPLLPMINFFPLTGLPIGLPYIDAGVARFITTRYDIIRDAIYLGDPRVIFPSTIVAYNPLYPIPYYSPYFSTPIVRYNSTYRNPEEVFGSNHRSRSPSRASSRASSRSSSRSPSRKRKEIRNRDKYNKYKQKYLELKAKFDKL